MKLFMKFFEKYFVKTFMKFILVSLILLITEMCSAKVLLVASEKAVASEYFEKCQKQNYLCFPQAIAVLNVPQTNRFEQLMQEFDLDSTKYLNNFSSRLAESLKSEDLNLDQLKIALSAATKINEVQKNKKSLNLALQLDQSVKFLETHIDSKTAHTLYFVAGKLIEDTSSNLEKLKSFLKILKSQYVTYNSVKLIASISSNNLNANSASSNNLKVNSNNSFLNDYFLQGTCDKPHFSDYIQKSNTGLQPMPFYSEGCGFTQVYTQNMDGLAEHFRLHQNKYYWGIGLAVAAVLLKKYEVVLVH